jgi:5-methylcytosine-specific restriction enzyme A
MPALKTCLDCGAACYPGPRCPEHTSQRNSQLWRRKRARRPLPAEVRRERETAVDAWVAEFGYVCPGWRRDPHPSTDLTADHVVPFAATGDEGTELVVICRSCNGRKSASLPT